MRSATARSKHGRLSRIQGFTVALLEIVPSTSLPAESRSCRSAGANGHFVSSRGVEKLTADSRPTVLWEINTPAAERLNLGRTGAWELFMGDIEEQWLSFLALTEVGNSSLSGPAAAGDDVIDIIAVHHERLK